MSVGVADCDYFLYRGNCIHGERCTFRHKWSVRDKQICQQWDANQARDCEDGGDCVDRHPIPCKDGKEDIILYYINLCFNLNLGENCRRIKCRFWHKNVASSATSAKSATSDTSLISAASVTSATSSTSVDAFTQTAVEGYKLLLYYDII